MSRVKVVMPQMGESITNGTITKWHKKVGDTIKIDETILDISTDKVESEIPSPVGGRVAALHYKEGDTIDVGIMIAEIEDDPSADLGAGTSAAPTAKAAPSVPKADQPSAEAGPAKEQGQKHSAPVEASAPAHTHASSGERRFFTPLVRAMAREAGVPLSELENIDGSGAGGRVNKQDLEDYLANRKSGGTAPARTASTSAQAPSAPKTQTAAGPRVEIIAMDNMRKKIAENMVMSKTTAPHVNSISEVDMSHLVKFREGYKATFAKNEGFNLTYTPFICRALIMALKEFPYVNASIEGTNIVLKKDINLGVAVAVPGNGLIVPVIQNADTLNMTGLCRAINTLALKARDKKLTLPELQGGTFTFTNVGSFGTLMATPIILQPQVGIYASGVIQKRAVVVEGDAIAVRSMMYGTHTYDHRLVDGEQGGKFLEAVHRNLREMKPENLF